MPASFLRGSLRGLLPLLVFPVFLGAARAPEIRPLRGAFVHVWTGGGADDNWTTAANWDTGAPAAGQQLVFNATGTAHPNSVNDFPAGTSFSSIVISSSGYNISGNSVALSAVLVQTYSADSSIVSLPITGTAVVTMNATGLLVLSGNSSYSGGVSLNSGTITVRASANALGTGTVTLGDGFGGSATATLLVGTSPLTIPNPIQLFVNSGAHSLGTSGSGITAVFSGGVTGSGNLHLVGNAPEISFQTAALNPSGTLLNETTGSGGTTTLMTGFGSSAQGVVEAGGTSHQMNVSGTITVNANTTLKLVSGGLTMNASTTGSGSLTLNTTSSGAIGVAGSLAHTGSVVNASTGTGSVDITATIAATVASVVQSSSTSAMSLSGSNSFGHLFINAGSVTGSGSANAFGAGTIDLGSASNGGGPDAALYVSQGGLTIPQPIFVQNSAGTRTIGTKAGVSTTFSGGVANGSVRIDPGNVATSTITFSGATFGINGDASAVGATAGTAVVISAPVGGSVNLVNSGANTLSVSGAITKNGAPSSITNSGSSTVTVSGGISGSGNLTISNNTATDNSLSITGADVNFAGRLTNAGTGTGVALVSAHLGSSIVDVKQQSTTSALRLAGGLTVHAPATTLSTSTGSAYLELVGADGTGGLSLVNLTSAANGFRLGGSIAVTGAITFDGNTNSSVLITGAISGATTALTQLVPETLTLTGASSYGGPTTITGTVIANSSAALGNGSATNGLVLNGTLQSSGAIVSPATRPITMTGSSTIDAVAGVTINGPMTAGAFVKQGSASLTLNGATSIGSLVISGGFLVGGPGGITVAGDWQNDAGFTHAGGTVTLAGTSDVIRGSTLTTFGNLTINANEVLLTTPIVIDGTLAFTKGKLSTLGNTVRVGPAGNITAAPGSYVIGKLERGVPNGVAPSLLFPVGDTASRAITITFAGTTTGSGSVVVTAATRDLGSYNDTDLDPFHTSRLMYHVANSGVGGFTSYTASVAHNGGGFDVGVDPTKLLMHVLSAGTWLNPVLNTATATSATGTGFTAFGDVHLAQLGQAVATLSALPATPDEKTVAGAVITVTLVKGTYNASLTAADFTLVAPAGITIASVARTSASAAALTLAFDGTHFSGQNFITVSIKQTALATTLAADVTGSIPLSGAFLTTVAVTSKVPSALTESNLGGATVRVQLSEGTFATSLTASGFTVGGMAGLSITSVTRNSSIQATLTLAFDKTDFDDPAVLRVGVLASSLATGVPATTPDVAVTPAAASSATLTGPTTVPFNTQSTQFSLASFEPNGSTMPVAVDRAFTMSSNTNGTATFRAANNTATSTITIPAGSQTVGLSYQDNAPGARTITAVNSTIGTVTASTTVGASLGSVRIGTLADSMGIDLALPTVTISVLDVATTVDLSFTGDVTIALKSNPAGATMTGTLKVAAVAGVAKFTDLHVDVAGTGYSLTATVPGRTNGTSTTFKAAEPPLDLTAAIVPSTANPVEGDTILVTVTVVNATDARGFNLIYNVPVPARMEFISATTTDGSYDATTGVWTIGTLGKKATATIVLKVRVKPKATTDPDPDLDPESITRASRNDR